MSGLTSSLNTDLLALAGESKRRNPEIKEAAERSVKILKTLKPGVDLPQELAKNADFLRPFLLACETKHVKLITISIGCLHKLISHRAVPESSVKTILKTLNDVLSQSVEIQLKILQTIPPLLSNYKALHGDLLAEALLICFRLQDSKVLVVNNTAAATLRQLVINIFEKVQEEDEINEKNGSIQPTSTVISIRGKGNIPLRPCARDAYNLFQDLCLLTNFEQPMFLRLHSLSRTFGLELIESHQEFVYLLQERVCPLINKSFADKSDFPTTMRLMRVVYILLKQFSDILVTECEIFLAMFVKNIEPDNIYWQRVISMEIFRGICSDSALLRSIYSWYDGQGHFANVFRDMINAFGRLATEKPQLIGHLYQGRESMDMAGMAGVVMGGVGQVDSPGLSIVNSVMKIQCIDQLDKADPPQIPETYLYYLAFVCLNSIADGLHNFVSSIFADVIQKQQHDESQHNSTTQQQSIFGNTTLQQLKSHPKYEEVLLVADMANTAWPGLLAAQSFFLTANIDEELFQGVLRAYQNFTIVCGVLRLSTPCDAFLTSLCKGAVPPSVIAAYVAESKAAHNSGSATGSGYDGTVMVTLSDRNLSCLKILLNIAQYLGGVLDDSWYLVLETLQLADFIIFPKHARGGSRGTRRVGTQHSASVSTSSLSSPQTAGSSSSSLAQSVSTAPVKRPYSGIMNFSGQTPVQSSQTGSSVANSVPQQTAMENDLNILLVQIRKLFDNCKLLDDSAIQFFTSALCKLNAYTYGVPLAIELSENGQGATFVEGKTPKSSPLSNLRGNKTDEKSFAIDKLRTVALSNIHRLIAREPALIWDLIVSNLITTANYISTPQQVRMQACESLSDIIITSMSYTSSAHMGNDERIQMQLLTSLSHLVNDPERASRGYSKGFYVEVQKMGLETLNKLLQTSGHSFAFGWGMIFDMIKSVCTINVSGEIGDNEGDTVSVESVSIIDGSFGVSNSKSSGLVRVAFPSLQLICTDFLSLLSPECLKQCINTLGAYGLQMDDLNISLSAIGLLWNVSDFIQTKRADLENSPDKHDEDVKAITKNAVIEQEIERIIKGDLTSHTMNALWMLLLIQLSRICSDSRPEVRNGANQTLFRTIDMNGSVLDIQTWHTCIWQVLFPLLNSVKLVSEKVVKAMQQQQQSPNSEKLTSQKEFNGFMVHHSRNTVDKQWDETKVLVLTGMSGIFKNFVPILVDLDDFKQVWGLFLSHLQDYCLHSSNEVAIAAVKSFHIIIQFPKDESHTDQLKKRILPHWQTAWIVWETIGLGIITKSDKRTHNVDMDNGNLLPSETLEFPISSQFTQDTLTAYVSAFGDLYNVINLDFGIDEIKRFLKVTYGVLTYSNSPSYRPDYDYLTPLQEAVLNVIGQIDLNVSGAPAVVLSDFADYITLAFTKQYWIEEAPEIQKNKKELISTKGSKVSNKENVSFKKSFPTVTYIVFSKTAMRTVNDLFKKFVKDQGIYAEGVFKKIIWAYGIPMKMKYDCPPSGKHVNDIELWKIAANAFLDVVKEGLIALESFDKDISDECFVDIWKQLSSVLHDALITVGKPPPTINLEQQDTNEAFDMKFLFNLQTEVIIHMGRPRVPQTLIRDIVETLREGSQLYSTDIERQEAVNGHLNKTSTTSNIERTTHAKQLEKVEGVTVLISPVARERFAYACLQCLFDLCSAEYEDDFLVRQRIAEVAAPILLERCASVIRNYTADQPLSGKFPFPSGLVNTTRFTNI
ncbi:8909_t:CDS:10 [Cetraspora pellucida]|uniref:8909_t:CDS:1 n=1 Tax=Cetraspora pellucida TaxID=1433469 RepID=A0ACA9KDW6_9GLOM|nr:8909_t:CDS:10 [Cetraspora pellucida]